LLQGEWCARRSVGPSGTPSGHGFDLMVNRSFAHRHLADFSSVVGLHLRSLGEGALERESKPGRIVGVVGDAREQGIDRPPVPVVYSCLSAPGPTPFFMVRTSGDALAVVGAVRARMKELEPLRSVYDVAVLDERIDGAYALRRLLTLLLVAFALSALSSPPWAYTGRSATRWGCGDARWACAWHWERSASTSCGSSWARDSAWWGSPVGSASVSRWRCAA
jgi:hypothetical protein